MVEGTESHDWKEGSFQDEIEIWHKKNSQESARMTLAKTPSDRGYIDLTTHFL